MTPLTSKQKLNLKIVSKKLRQAVVTMTSAASAGHPGGSLSCIDILTLLSERHLTFTTKSSRSKHHLDNLFVLSKGHAAPALYAMLAHKQVISPTQLKSFRQLGSPLQGHPDLRFLPQAGSCTGSLGQGLSVALGMALGAKLRNSAQRIFALVGDGEINEGMVWEATLTAAHHQLDNLTVIIDHNGFQQTGTTSQILNTDPIETKFQAFNWTTFGINGHDFDQINWALDPDRVVPNRPTAIVAYTTKGKGVSFMEGDIAFHGTPANSNQLKQALNELK